MAGASMKIYRSTLLGVLFVCLAMLALVIALVIGEDGCSSLAHLDTAFGQVCAQPYLGGKPKS